MKKSACSVLRLQGISFVIAFLISVCCTLSGCSSSIPPTLVLAWIGPGGRVSTLESNMLYSTSNGPVFQNRKDDHAIGATVGIGPTIAYNKKSTWMLMWANGAELQYRIGIGGLPRIAPGGIAWEQNFYSGKLSVSPGGSPALAYGNDRWVVVFRQSGQLHVVRTQSQSNTEWETPRDIMVSNIPALTDEDPALAFGIVNGQGTFVLVYTQPDFSVVAVTSSDGLIWSSPVPIRSMTLKAPALCENDGIFYTLLAGGSGGSEASGTSHIIYKSRDGISWSEVGRYGRTALSGTGPGMAYGVFDGAGKMIVTEQIGGALGLGAIFTGISIRIGTPNGPFNNPTSFSFTENQPVVGSGIESVGNTGARTAVAFGGIPPVKENLWAGVNNGDIFDEPDDKIDKMLTEMAKADLRVVRIIVDLRLEMDEDGNPLPYGVYNDLLLEQIDNFMVKAKRKGILLLIAFDLHNFIGGHPIPVDEEFYGWRNCKTPINIYQLSLTEGAQPVYDPYYSRGLGGDYLTNPVAKALYRLRVNHILNHINPHFGKPWKDINDVIWAWALQSEPEYLPQGTNVEYLRSWLSEMATFVRSRS
ncbi:MAG: hypothetical protein QG641_376, partial [Candidatus Poribacteria bacterium]|nr:hypothetical protein [Candidatus Poribacteria bacterium]